MLPVCCVVASTVSVRSGCWVSSTSTDTRACATSARRPTRPAGRRAPRLASRRLVSQRCEKSGLAEISGFTSRARSLLCERPIWRRTANSEGAGRQTEFRGTDPAGCAVPTSEHGADAGLRSSAQRGGIRAVSRLSRSVFSVCSSYMPPLAYQPAPLRRRNRRLGGSRCAALRSHAEPANRDT